MTVKEAIGAVIDKLSNVNVPVTMMQNVGMPVYECIELLKQVDKAIQEAEQKSDHSEQEDTPPTE